MARHQHENKGRKAEATRSKSEAHTGHPKHRQRTQREVEDIEERSTPPTPIIYEVIRKLGEEEMGRPVTSLWWSGLAAGLSISFSLLAQAILETHLPHVAWRSLVSSFGYSVGFIMVVLSRQQFFTENKTLWVAQRYLR
jgi:formate-nitrite transporter family protein